LHAGGRRFDSDRLHQRRGGGVKDERKVLWCVPAVAGCWASGCRLERVLDDREEGFGSWRDGRPSGVYVPEGAVGLSAASDTIRVGVGFSVSGVGGVSAAGGGAAGPAVTRDACDRD
jgi:hypothetical protein